MKENEMKEMKKSVAAKAIGIENAHRRRYVAAAKCGNESGGGV
jgi:hypothetical protein